MRLDEEGKRLPFQYRHDPRRQAAQKPLPPCARPNYVRPSFNDELVRRHPGTRAIEEGGVSHRVSTE
eukprot:gene4566-5716_t